MSSLLRECPSIFTKLGSKKTPVLSITASMQGEFGRGVVFDVDGKYATLAENQVEDLIEALKKRLECQKGYSATDWPEAFERVEAKADKSKDVKTLETL